MQVVDEIRTFVAEHMIGRELEIEGQPELARQVRERFDGLGVANWWLGEDLGGRALPFTTGVEISRELSYGDAGLATSLYISVLPTMIIELFGTREQAEQVLRPLVSGGGLAIAASEEYGSEVMRGKTSARRTAEGWALDGTKLYSTNVAFASHYLVLARREDEGDFRFFIVPRDAEGVAEPKPWDMAGIRSALTYELNFEGCAVAEANMVNVDGLRALSSGLNFSRLLIAAMGWGIALRARDLVMAFAARKKFRKGVLAENAAFRQQLGEIELDLATMEAVIMRGARALDAINASETRAQLAMRTGAAPEALVAKAVSGELAWKIAGRCAEIAGAYGYTEGSLFPKLTRDARVVSFVEGGRSVVLDYLGYSRIKAASS